MRTLYLHIGTAKTGTSSLQSFLHANRNALSSAGFLVPRSLGFPNHIGLAVASHRHFHNNGLCHSLGIHSEEEWLEFTKSEWSKFHEEVGSRTEKNVILSSEVFYGSMISREDIACFKNKLESQTWDEVKVVVYLREQAAFAAAHHSTDLTYWGSLREKPPWPDDSYFSRICDYKSTIQDWSSVFGERSMLVRLFAKDQDKKFSVVDDFVSEVLAIDGIHFDCVPAKNQSISAHGLEVIRLVNARLPFVADGMINPLRRGLGAYVRKHFPGRPYALDDDLRDAYQSAFADGNEWVRQTYFPERNTLFETQNQVSTNNDTSLSADLNREAEHVIAFLRRKNFLRDKRKRFMPQLKRWMAALRR